MHGTSAIDDGCRCCREDIFLKIVFGFGGQSAVYEKQPFMSGVGSKEIAYCSASDIVFSYDMPAVGQGSYGVVALYCCLVGGTVLSHNDFVRQ